MAKQVCDRVSNETRKAKILATLETALEKNVVHKSDIESLFSGLPAPEPLRVASGAPTEVREADERPLELLLSPKWSVVLQRRHAQVVTVSDGFRTGYTTTL